MTKLDLDANTSESFAGVNSGYVYRELVFVVKTDAENEDDGWILLQVYDGTSDKNFLGITDAVSLVFVARVWRPSRFPLGFHVNFTREYSLHT